MCPKERERKKQTNLHENLHSNRPFRYSNPSYRNLRLYNLNTNEAFHRFPLSMRIDSRYYNFDRNYQRDKIGIRSAGEGGREECAIRFE